MWGRSKEMARPSARRYRFSWSKLSSSCCLEGEEDRATGPGLKAEPPGGWLRSRQTGHGHPLTVRAVLQASGTPFHTAGVVLTHPTPGGGDDADAWKCQPHWWHLQRSWVGTLQTYLTICSSCLACSSACSSSVTSWSQTRVRTQPHASLPTLFCAHPTQTRTPSRG